MVVARGNAYLLKNGTKSFGDGIQDTCKGAKVIWEQLPVSKAEIVFK